MIFIAPQGPLFWLLVAFLATFLVTRAITFLIRICPRRIANISVGALHLHHMIWGVGLVLASGTIEFASGSHHSWNSVAASAFGAGAALVLDEFALIVHLRDVYWSAEGRLSIDAVIAMVVALAMLLIPLSPHYLPADPLVVALFVLAYGAMVLVTLAKGRAFIAVLGIVVPPVLIVGVVRLARPGSHWAHWRYRADSEKLRRAALRFGSCVERGGRLGRLRGVVAGTIAIDAPAEAPADRDPVAEASRPEAPSVRGPVRLSLPAKGLLTGGRFGGFPYRRVERRLGSSTR